MNILQILPYYAPAWEYGGPPKLMYEIAKGLVRRGHSVTVCATDAFNKDTRIAVKENNLDGIEIHYFRNISNSLAWNKKKFIPLGLNKYLLKNINRFDIVHFSGMRTFLNMIAYPIIRKNRIPYVIDAHGSLPISTKAFKQISSIYDLFFVKPMLKNANMLFAQTEHEAKLYNGFTDNKNISIIPLAINLKEFSNLEMRMGLFKNKYNINNRFILFLGRFNSGKIGILIESFKIINAKHKCVKLVIAGRDDGYRKEIDNKINKLNLKNDVYIIEGITGEERINAYVDADLFLFTPSYYEETSLASLEAMACNTPAIVTEQAEIPWIEQFHAGYCVPFNISEVENRVNELLDSEEKLKVYAKNARKLIEEKYNLEKRIVEIEKCFANILNKG
jgi:glycosyltransferase involved in cell wall biosynthesis